jgi:hypothetical protein
MTIHLPSLQALDASDDRLLHEELRCLAVREQAAVVRALADHLEHFAPSAAPAGLRGQLVEELARLGCRAFETAAALSATERQSGIFAISSVDIYDAS